MSKPSDETVAPLPKLDPETLVLRARPARPIRFKRGMMVSIAALGAVTLVTTAWIALKPTAFHLASASDAPAVGKPPPDDTLSVLPKNYGNVPQLGPPLPGDLGRPMLERQDDADNILRESGGRGTDAVEHRRAALQAARQSALLVALPEGASAGSPDAPSPRGAGLSTGSPPTSTAARMSGPSNEKTAFIAATDTSSDINPYPVRPPASPDMLSAGSVIAASLITGLRSDLPGPVIAQVTERVFDSATGRIELIPQGARLIGSYDSVVAFGQRRALIVWQRIVMPDGSSLKIDNVPATDPSGYAGLSDKVDFHTWTPLKGVALSTLLGVGANLSFTGGDDLVQAIRQSGEQNVARAGDQITSRNLQIQPTITIRPGTPVRLVVHRDLILTPWKE